MEGWTIPCRQMARADRVQRRCDRYGEQLALAALPGAHWDIEHDFFARVVTTSIYRAGVRGEDTPRTLFISCGLPHRVVLDGQEGEPVRRHGIVPDALLATLPRPRGTAARWAHTQQFLS